MREIWVLINQSSRCSGHGECSPLNELGVMGFYGTGGFHPAFRCQSDALLYCDDRGLHHLTPVKLDIVQEFIR
jgi:hypothetical protein